MYIYICIYILYIVLYVYLDDYKTISLSSLLVWRASLWSHGWYLSWPLKYGYGEQATGIPLRTHKSTHESIYPSPVGFGIIYPFKKKQIPVFYSWWSMPPYQLLVNQNKKSTSNLFCLKSHCRLPRLSWSVRSIYFLPCFLSLHMETFIQKTYSNPQKDRKSASRMVVPWCSSPITSRFPNCSIIPEWSRPRKNSRLGGTLFYDQLGGNRHNWEAPKKC